MNTLSYHSAASALGLVILFGYATALAQSAPPALSASSGLALITWSAESYVPTSFEGKIFPTMRSPVHLALQVVENGKFVDLSNRDVRWYLDGKLLKGGRGLTEISVLASAGPGTAHQVRAEVVDGRDRLYEELIDIPIAVPSVAIWPPYPRQLIKAGTYVFEAMPHFFNAKEVSALAFRWTVNTMAPAETGAVLDPQVLAISVPEDAPAGAPLAIDVTVTNTRQAIEQGRQFITLYVAP